MKKFLIFLIVLFAFNGAIGQTDQPCVSCLPEGIIFFTQAEIDNFQTNYPNCTQIEGNVTISGPNITNLYGLSELTAIGGGLDIGSYNFDLLITSLSGLENLTSIGGDLHIIASLALTSLMGLEGLTSIGGNCLIWGNQALNTLSGLENLQSIADTTVIQMNPSLTSLIGLDNLTFIGGGLSIHDNEFLACLTGLDSVTNLGGSLNVGLNSALLTLTGLESLTSIDGGLFIYQNIALTTLVGLENIEAGSITKLYIVGNDSLSACKVKSICYYLANPNGSVSIGDNATGCNSQQEVKDSCAAFGIESLTLESSLIIYPNPTSTQITISTPIKGSFSILNISGQQLLQQEITEPTTTIDVCGLKSGVYFVRVTGERTVKVGKFVKN